MADDVTNISNATNYLVHVMGQYQTNLGSLQAKYATLAVNKYQEAQTLAIQAVTSSA